MPAGEAGTALVCAQSSHPVIEMDPVSAWPFESETGRTFLACRGSRFPELLEQ